MYGNTLKTTLFGGRGVECKTTTTTTTTTWQHQPCESFHSAFSLTAPTTGPLEFGIWKFVWRYKHSYK